MALSTPLRVPLNHPPIPHQTVFINHHPETKFPQSSVIPETFIISCFWCLLIKANLLCYPTSLPNTLSGFLWISGTLILWLNFSVFSRFFPEFIIHYQPSTENVSKLWKAFLFWLGECWFPLQEASNVSSFLPIWYLLFFLSLATSSVTHDA